MNTFKKGIALGLVGFGLMLFVLTKQSSAAVSDTINVTVTVDVVSVSVASSTWALGQIATSDIRISSAIQVTNDGNRQEDYSLSLTYTGSWSVSSDQTAGSDEFVMLGLFTTHANGALVDAEFGEGGSGDDLVETGGPDGASATNYAITSEAASA